VGDRGRGIRDRRPGIGTWARTASVTATLALAAATGAAASERGHLDARVLAHVPSPGYPADSAVGPDGTIWTGSYFGALQYPGPSKIFAFSPAGELLKTVTVAGQDPSGTRAVAAFAFDAEGRLYAGDYAPGAGKAGRMLRFVTETGAQETYATFPDIPVCSTAPPGTDCAQAEADSPPGPDFATFDAAGRLYVTDFQQGVIWRVPRGGGQAQLWLSDPRLDGGGFGPSGLQFLPDGRTLLFAVSSTGGVPLASQGVVYAVEVGDDGRPGNMREFWRSAPGEGPNGIAIARSGHVYVTLAFANQVVEFSPQGQEIGRVPVAPGQDPTMDPPFDTPSGIHFDGDRLLVANIAYTSGDQSRHVIFDVWAGEPGEPLLRPALSSAGASPRIRLRVAPAVVRAGRSVRLKFRATRRSAGRPGIPGALIRIGGRRVRTDARGRATVAICFSKAGPVAASAQQSGLRAGQVTIRVARATRPACNKHR
jgi:sugar lactone lactonase YvrE